MVDMPRHQYDDAPFMEASEMTPNTVDHDDAVTRSRYWYNRYIILPRWRWHARKDALELARLWGIIAKLTKTTG